MFKKNLRHSCRTPTNLDLYPPMEKKAIEKGRCKVPSKGGILAIKKWLVGLQNLWDNNQDIYTKVFEQPTTTY